MTPTIAVVTKVPDPTKDSGNLCAPLTYPDPDKPITQMLRQLQMAALTKLRVENFTLGEILILDGNERDYGTTRKPSKWAISTQACETLEEACALSRKVTEEAGP